MSGCRPPTIWTGSMRIADWAMHCHGILRGGPRKHTLRTKSVLEHLRAIKRAIQGHCGLSRPYYEGVFLRAPLLGTYDTGPTTYLTSRP